MLNVVVFKNKINFFLDVIGIVKISKTVQNVYNSKKGEVQLRELELVDETNTQVCIF